MSESHDSKIEAVREWLRSCPALAGARIGVDYLAADIGSWVIDVMPTSPVLKTYITGATQRQYTFEVAAKLPYADDITNNIENLTLCESVESWIKNTTTLPELPEGCSAQSAEVTSTAYASYADTRTARYSVTGRIIYKED